MTPLRQRFIHDLQLRNRSPRTVQSYVHHLKQFALFFGNTVLRTTGRGDSFNVNWQVARTGIYTIFVVNEGGVYNEYRWRAY